MTDKIIITVEIFEHDQANRFDVVSHTPHHCSAVGHRHNILTSTGTSQISCPDQDCHATLIEGIGYRVVSDTAG